MPLPLNIQISYAFNSGFEQQVALTPEAIALSADGVALTYDSLNQLANRLAQRLLELGAAPEQLIGICLHRSVASIVGLLAILKAGAAYLPLDPAAPRERLAYILQDAGVSILLTDMQQMTQLACDGIVCIGIDEEPDALDRIPNPACRTQARNLAYCIYTSGSTGQPKGCLIEHRSVLRLVINSGFAPLSKGDCVAHCANPAFDAATWEIWGALLNGARLHLITPEQLLSAKDFGNALVAGGVSALWLTAGLFHEYADALEAAFAQLDWLLAGGDVLDAQIVERVLSRARRPQHLLNGYGPDRMHHLRGYLRDRGGVKFLA